MSTRKDRLTIEFGIPDTFNFSINFLPQRLSSYSKNEISLENYLKRNPKKYLIFDFDETIVNLNFDLNPLREMLRKGLAKICPELIKKYPSGSTFNLQNEAIAKYGKRVRKLILKIADDYEKKFVGKVGVNVDIVNFIKANQNRYSMYIWSINTQRTIQKYSKLVGINNCFKRVIGRDDVDFIKYYPDGFYLIYDPEVQKRSDYLLIGDSDKSDGVAAILCGIDFYKVVPEKVKWERL